MRTDIEKKIKNQLEQLDHCQKQKNWPALSKTYYDLGVTAMAGEDWNKAFLWLNRARQIFSAEDEIFVAVGEGLMDDCTNRIGDLENRHLLYRTFLEDIEKKAEALTDIQLRIWGLLSLARLTQLWTELSVHSNCGVLGKLDKAVDYILKTFQFFPTEEELDALSSLCLALYHLGDSPAFWGEGDALARGIGRKPKQMRIHICLGFDFS